MIKSSTGAAHGGDIYENRIQYDFSVNVNPLPLPPELLDRAAAAVYRSTYPQYGNARLRERIAEALSVPAACVLCGNGASELFAALVHALRPRVAAVLVPCFSGYAYAAQMEGKVRTIPLRPENGFAVTPEILSSLDGAELLFLASPNNPTGRCIGDAALREILQACEEKGITVVLDECFIGFTGKEGALSLLARFPHLVIVRAFTKLYGIPGLRLGVLLADAGLCARIARQLPEWNVSLPAQEAGLAILGDGWDRKRYLTETVRLVQTERQFLRQQLAKLFGGAMTVFDSEANFLLLKTAFPLYETLLTHGILLRDCSNFTGLTQGYYRIAVRTRAENERLLAALASAMGK